MQRSPDLPKPSRTPLAFSEYLAELESIDSGSNSNHLEAVVAKITAMLRPVQRSFSRVVGRIDAFEDMVQMVLLKACRDFTIREVDFWGQLGVWVYRAGENYCRQQLRHQRPLRSSQVQEDEDLTAQVEDQRPPSETAESREFRSLFLAVLDVLPKPQDRTVNFLMFCGKSSQWIANAFGKKLDAVNTNWFSRARRALREHWIKLHGARSWHDYFPNDNHDRDADNGGHERGIGD